MKTNPIVSRYVPAIGSYLRDRSNTFHRVRYEDLVQSPEESMTALSNFLELDFEEGLVEYGRQKHITKSYGDPMSVEKTPTTGHHIVEFMDPRLTCRSRGP